MDQCNLNFLKHIYQKTRFILISFPFVLFMWIAGVIMLGFGIGYLVMSKEVDLVSLIVIGFLFIVLYLFWYGNLRKTIVEVNSNLLKIAELLNDPRFATMSISPFHYLRNFKQFSNYLKSKLLNLGF